VAKPQYSTALTQSAVAVVEEEIASDAQEALAAVLAEGLITREESARIFRVSAAVESQRTLAAALAAAVPHLRVATVVHRLAEQVELEVFLT
jgi:hypothetical protein